MKITLVISLIFSSFLLFSCNAKKTEKFEMKSTEIVKEENPVSDSLRFDIKKYNETRIKTGHYDFDFIENGKNIRQRYSLPESNSPESEGEYVEEISKKWTPFVIRKKYDYVGRLRRWSTTFRLESINKSYEYDESGKVIKITNYEDKFKHSFADIREFLLKEKDIDIYDTRQAIARRINHKSQKSKEAYYDIYVLDKNDEKKDYRIVIFDDNLKMEEYRNENEPK